MLATHRLSADLPEDRVGVVVVYGWGLHRFVSIRGGPGRVEGFHQSLNYLHPVGSRSQLGVSYGFRGLRYTDPIALLTNRRTFSAAESFVLAMRTLPQVTIVGDTTGGGSGNPLHRELPNGWGLSVSRNLLGR